MSLTERLTHAVTTALTAAGLPDVSECVWEVPRQAEHGDYATNVAMTLARSAKRPPRQIAEAIVRHFPPTRRGAPRRCVTSSPPGPGTDAARISPGSACGWSSSPRIRPARS
jgi:arginyl-tRNA synthetase